MIPEPVLQAISRAVLPCFLYDACAIKERARAASLLLDRYFFPVKACPEPEAVRAAIAAGCGLDLCSEGDIEIAAGVACPGEAWKFTSIQAAGTVLNRLSKAGALLDADSLEQALCWGACGGKACGLRIAAQRPSGLYGRKFGVPAQEVAAAAQRLAAVGVRLEGLHIHDQHANLTPGEFAARLADNLTKVDVHILRECRYVNIGGSWPMRHGNPAAPAELQQAFSLFRKRLAGLGFKGALYGEPGRWVVGPCGYWAARVIAVKAQLGGEHRVVVLDTSTPVPCRPSLAPFMVMRGGNLVKGPRTITCDIFGSANTAVDAIGADVRLPSLAPGDIVVSLGQGAYTRALIPPFNEREPPSAFVLGG